MVNPGSVVSSPVVSASRTFTRLDVEIGAEVEVRPWGEEVGFAVKLPTAQCTIFPDII